MSCSRVLRVIGATGLAVLLPLAASADVVVEQKTVDYDGRAGSYYLR